MTVLTHQEVWDAVETAFGDLGWDIVNIMTATCLAESGGNVEIVNDNYPRWQTENSPYRYDYGLAQINSVHGYDVLELVSNVDYNLSAARDIYNRQGLDAWYGYKWGYYKQYLRLQMPVRLLPEELQAVFITEFYNGPEPKHPNVLRSELKVIGVDGQWDEYMIRIKRPKDYEGRV